MKTALFRSLTVCYSIAILVALALGPAAAQTPTGWHDDLVDHLTGVWKLQGPVMGHPGHHDVEAE